MEQVFSPTRSAALETLTEFVPRAGSAYARHRNHDLGARRDNVSGLSPYLRHRLITEREVVAATLAAHPLSSAEKFVQEVFWRTYWKGWLEQRPEVWRRYRRDLDETATGADHTGADHTGADYSDAVAGRTGIEAMDAWTRELIDTGYLHNHTRMWFASIWIFTLHLPWQLGADFFYRHLIDGDAASNTLSWRWVAGLQTAGKTYLATADNIARYTDGRFAPTGLATVARALDEDPVPSARPIPPVASPVPGTRIGLLLHEEDLHPESLPIPRDGIAAVAGASDAASRSALPVAANVQAFTDGALDDATGRAAAAFGLEAVRLATADPSAVLEWAASASLDTVAIPYPPVGPVQERMLALEPVLASEGVALVRIRREWDELAWPHAARGFFPFRERIPSLLRSQGLTG